MPIPLLSFLHRPGGIPDQESQGLASERRSQFPTNYYIADRLKTHLPRIKLRRVGPNTITDRDTLLKELGKIRKQGFAKSIGEKLEGGVAISTPVKGYVCPVSLTLLAPEYRFGHIILKYVQELKKSAVIISKRVMTFTQELKTQPNMKREKPTIERS